MTELERLEKAVADAYAASNAADWAANAAEAAWFKAVRNVRNYLKGQQDN